MQRLYLAIALFLLPLEAQAQERMEEYLQAATEGQEAFNRGEFAEARRLWQHARSILPNPRVYRLLGRAADALNEHVEAVRMYRLALSAPENGNPLTDARRTEVEDVLLPQAMAHVGEILLEVEPSDAAITVDGHPADVQDGSLLLPVGPHTLVVRRPGYADDERRIEVLARMREPLSIALVAEGSSNGEAPPPPPQNDSAGPDLTGPIVLFAVAGVGLATFAIAGGMALGENSSIAAECGSDLSVPACTPDQLSGLRTMTAIADVGWVTSLIALTAGFVWLGVAVSGGGERAMRIAPWAYAGGGGLTLGGTL